MVHCQVERDDTVATGDVSQHIGCRVGCRMVSHTVDPSELVAYGVDFGRGGAAVDGQVEGDHTVASGGIGCNVGCRIGGGGIGYVVDPGELVAGRLYVGRGIAVVHRQIQCHHAVATGGVGSRECRCVGRSGVGRAVNPGVGVASRGVVDRSGVVFHRQVECDDAVAAVSGGQQERFAKVGSGIGMAVNPCVGFAGTEGVDSFTCGQHSQVEVDNTIVAFRQRERLSVETCGVGIETMIAVRLVLANCVVDVRSENGNRGLCLDPVGLQTVVAIVAIEVDNIVGVHFQDVETGKMVDLVERNRIAGVVHFCHSDVSIHQFVSIVAFQ